MSFFSSLKKISLKKVVATVKKTVKDATNVATGVATGGVAGGLAAVGSLSKAPTLTPTTVYGSDAAAAAAGNTNAALGTGPPAGQSNMLPWILGGAAVVLLFVLMKKG